MCQIVDMRCLKMEVPGNDCLPTARTLYVSVTKRNSGDNVGQVPEDQPGRSKKTGSIVQVACRNSGAINPLSRIRQSAKKPYAASRSVKVGLLSLRPAAYQLPRLYETTSGPGEGKYEQCVTVCCYFWAGLRQPVWCNS